MYVISRHTYVFHHRKRANHKKMTKNIDINVTYQNIAIIIAILRDISCDNVYLLKMIRKLYAFSIITGKIYDASYDND